MSVRTPSSTPARSLMRLAVVERQLIMQDLDLKSLARFASTCRQLQSESLHSQCGAFLSGLVGLSHIRLIVSGVIPAAHSSPLFRAHIPMSLHIPSRSAAELEAALESALARISLFRKIQSLRIPFQGWPESVALRFLAHACAATISKVSMARAEAACPSLAVERALWSLPGLTRVDLGTSSLSHFDPQSLALAKGIRQITVMMRTHHVRTQLQPLIIWPLESLTLREFRSISSRPQVFAASLPHLTHLTLSNSMQISHAQTRALFSQLPALMDLHIEHSDTAMLMLGAGDVGQSGLPALRRCTVMSERPPTLAELRRFLWRLPRLDSFVLQLSQFSSTDQTLAILRDFSAWGPPVSLDFGQPHPRPPPMPEVDDTVVDIAFDADAPSSDEDPTSDVDDADENVEEAAAPMPPGAAELMDN